MPSFHHFSDIPLDKPLGWSRGPELHATRTELTLKDANGAVWATWNSSGGSVATAASGEKINNVDSDGTQEYLCTDTDLVRVTKVSDSQGWVAQSITNLGAVRTAVVPD